MKWKACVAAAIAAAVGWVYLEAGAQPLSGTRHLTGSGDPNVAGATCALSGVGVDTYTDTATDEQWYCSAVDTWRKFAGGAGASDLDSLTDVTLTTPATGATLIKSAGDWVDGQLDLADVDAVTGLLPSSNIAADITRDTETFAAGDVSGSVAAGVTIDTAAVDVAELANTLTFEATAFLDLSGIDSSTLTEGLKLPQHATACATGFGEGQVCWEGDADPTLKIGNGAAFENLIPLSGWNTEAEFESIAFAVVTPGEAVNNLTDLGDVTLTSPATGATLIKSAGDWIDGQLDLADPDAITGLLPDGNIPSGISRDSEAVAAGDISGSLSGGYTIDADVVDFPTIDYSLIQAATDIGFLVDECYFTKEGAVGGGFVCEGSTADANEQTYLFPDVNGADTTERIVTDTATQTLTNKTLAASTNAIDLDAGVTVTGIIDNQMIVGTGAGTTNYETLVDCADGTESPDFDFATNAWVCNTITGGSASNSFETWNTDLGVNPVADGSTDTIDVTSAIALAITGSEGPPDSATFDFDYSNEMAALDIAMAVDECVFRADAGGLGGGFVCEGSAANANEQEYFFPDVDGADTQSFIAVDDKQVTDLEGTALAISGGVLGVPANTITNTEILNTIDLVVDTVTTADQNPADAANVTTLFDNDTNLTTDPTCALSGTAGKLTLVDADEGAVPVDWQFCDGTSILVSLSNLDGASLTMTAGVLAVDDAFVLNTGDAIAGDLDFNDGVTDSPKATFTPATGTAFSIFTQDAGDDLRVEAATAVTENVEFENTGVGLLDVLIETADGVLTSLTSAAHVTTGTFADARVDGSLEADELVLAGDVDGTANANDIDELAVEAEIEAILDLADLQEKDIDSLTGQANWGTAATKETADLIINGVEVDYEAGAAEGFPRLAQSATPPAAECDAAAESGRLYLDTDADTDGSVFFCRGASGWKDIDDDGAGGGAPTNAQYVVMALDATLTDERVLTGGTDGIDVVDGGAGGNATLNFDATEVGTETWLDNADRTWTFDIAAAGVNPTAAFAASSIEFDADFTIDNQQDLRLKEGDAGGENYLAFDAPATVTTNQTCTLLDAADMLPDTCVGGVLADELIGASELTGAFVDSSADIVDATVAEADLASEDYGDFTCGAGADDCVLDSGVVDATAIADGTVDQPDIDDTDTLAGNPDNGANAVWFGTTGLIFEGATNNLIEGLLTSADPTTTDKTWTFPDLTGTVIVDSGAQTLSDKTIDGGLATTTHAAGANFLSTLRHATDCTAITDGKDGEICFEQDANSFFVCEPTAGDCDTAGEWTSAGGGGSGDITDVGPGCATGACFTDTVLTTGTIMFLWEGTASDANQWTLNLPANPTAVSSLTVPDGTAALTLPTGTDTLIGKATTDTLTNKTIDTAPASNNTLIRTVEIDINADAWVVNATNPPTSSTIGTTFVRNVLDFADGADDEISMEIEIPSSYDNSVVPKLNIVWSSTATTGTVCWCLEAISVADSGDNTPVAPAPDCASTTVDATATDRNETLITFGAGTDFVAGAGGLMHLFRDQDESEAPVCADTMAAVASFHSAKLSYQVSE